MSLSLNNPETENKLNVCGGIVTNLSGVNHGETGRDCPPKVLTGGQL